MTTTPGTGPDQLGRVERSGGDADDAGEVRLVFDRLLPAPVARVWAGLTDNALLSGWFGTWSGDPTSGTVDVVMGAEDGAPSEVVTIDACRPPDLLAVTTGGPDGRWPLRMALAAVPEGTALRFEHLLAEPHDATSIGPGWHFYLDRLLAVLTGTEVPDDWEAYAALGEHYR